MVGSCCRFKSNGMNLRISCAFPVDVAVDDLGVSCGFAVDDLGMSLGSRLSASHLAFGFRV